MPVSSIAYRYFWPFREFFTYIQVNSSQQLQLKFTSMIGVCQMCVFVRAKHHLSEETNLNKVWQSYWLHPNRTERTYSSCPAPHFCLSEHWPSLITCPLKGKPHGLTNDHCKRPSGLISPPFHNHKIQSVYTPAPHRRSPSPLFIFLLLFFLCPAGGRKISKYMGGRPQKKQIQNEKSFYLFFILSSSFISKHLSCKQSRIELKTLWGFFSLPSHSTFPMPWFENHFS